jgi:xylulose-5-phosphate/fructose-6-phosphate phosphoketolase
MAPADAALLARMHAYWQAANYLSAGQIYLQANPLLREPLQAGHVKPRLLGHWGTTPGLNFIYVHLNRAIIAHGLSVLYIAGPGHGGPGLLANAYLEGSYSERFPPVSQDAAGMLRLFRQFSFPGGVSSHAGPSTPGSIHEGGELGYSLSHAFGAAFDNPGLLVACVVGDGEAETGALATSWHSNKFLNPARDGAVLPILHLNGYKIAGPTVLARILREELAALFEGYGYEPFFVEGGEPASMHRLMAHTLDTVASRIATIQTRARQRRHAAPALADDCAAHAQRLDRPGRRRRQAGRGHVPRPPGAAGRAGATRPSGRAGVVAAQLPAADAVRRHRPPAGRAGRACPTRRHAHERESLCRRRRPTARPGPAGFSRLCL